MHIVLVAPQIAPNTGNIIRLSANVGAELHIVKPLGFSLDDRLLQRAGLDYHELATMRVHQSWEQLQQHLGTTCHPTGWFALSDRGTVRVDTPTYTQESVLVFGCESTGLPTELLHTFPPENRVQIPMRPGNRSLNLANAVAVVAYEAWRQQNYAGSASRGAATLESIAQHR